MDAIDLMEQGLQEAKTAIDEIDGSSSAKKRPLVEALRRGLEMHDSIGKNIFYPWLESMPKTLDLARRDDAIREAKEISLGQLEALSAEDKAWADAFDVLRGCVARQRIEESACFKGVRMVMGDDELVLIGHKIAAERERLLRSYSPNAPEVKPVGAEI
jgi:hypothetical protein